MKYTSVKTKQTAEVKVIVIIVIIYSVYTLTQTGDREFWKFKPSTRGESAAGGAAASPGSPAPPSLLHLSFSAPQENA